MGKGSIRQFVLDKINAYPEWDYAEWAVTGKSNFFKNWESREMREMSKHQ